MIQIEQVYHAIDQINSTDPNMETSDYKQWPKELLYGQRMTEMLNNYKEEASEALKIASRGQHIKRWVIPRSEYPMNRKGYLKWRTDVKLLHGEELTKILKQMGAEQDLVIRVNELVTKKRLKNDPETQELEDVVCLVFLKYYLADFSEKHEDEKVIAILRKTWAKMTTRGHSMANELTYAGKETNLIQKALSN